MFVDYYFQHNLYASCEFVEMHFKFNDFAAGQLLQRFIDFL